MSTEGESAVTARRSLFFQMRGPLIDAKGFHSLNIYLLFQEFFFKCLISFEVGRFLRSTFDIIVIVTSFKGKQRISSLIPKVSALR